MSKPAQPPIERPLALQVGAQHGYPKPCFSCECSLAVSIPDANSKSPVSHTQLNLSPSRAPALRTRPVYHHPGHYLWGPAKAIGNHKSNWLCYACGQRQRAPSQLLPGSVGDRHSTQVKKNLPAVHLWSGFTHK